MDDCIQSIKMVIFDVDGVLTDGRIIIDSDGKESRFFDVQDGAGIYFLHHLNYHTAIISGKKSKSVALRAEELNIRHVYLGISRKKKILLELMEKLCLKPQEICYIGDDLIDIPVLSMIGFPVAVANGRAEVKEVAKYTTVNRGGRGAVREVAELIIKTQDKWNVLLEKMHNL